MVDSVLDMCDELCRARLDGFEVEAGSVVEQAPPAADRHRHDMKPQLIDQARGKVLIDDVRAAGDHHIFLTRRRPGLFQR